MTYKNVRLGIPQNASDSMLTQGLYRKSLKENKEMKIVMQIHGKTFNKFCECVYEFQNTLICNKRQTTVYVLEKVK